MQENQVLGPSMASRRRLLQACAITIGAGLIGAQGVRSAAADQGDAGADGAPPSPGQARVQGLAPADLGTTSYNGWTVGTPGSVIGVQSYTVPGTSIVLQVRSGDVATVLVYLAQRFHAEVENLINGQCGGYAYRPNVNNPSVWSNHASGTAIDLNWAVHPNGAPNTFTAEQTAAVRNILAYCGRVVYWGQDYRGTVDGMHFEINVPPGDARLTALAAKIRSGSTEIGTAPGGYLDSARAVPGSKIQVTGWAFDFDRPTTAIQVAAYLDGVGIGWMPTGGSRPDVNRAFGITGNHGFDFQIVSPPGDHLVQLYAINVGGGTANPLIGSSQVRVGAPLGSLDNVAAVGRTVFVQGWAFDIDLPGSEIQVAVYRDGQFMGWFPTGGFRPDVNAVYSTRGGHGFNVEIDTPPGVHRFDVYAINIGAPADNPLIGSRSVQVN